MNYGVYKNARNAAWQCLIDFNITELPVKVSDIAKKSGIKIIKNSKVNLLRENESGLTVLQKGKFYIIYRDTEPYERCRFTIAHELGHIFLGHVMTDKPGYRTFGKGNDTERAANVFARSLLAPACVLHELGAADPETISKICNVSITAASVRAERLQLLEERNAWYYNPLERKVYRNFKRFVRIRRKYK